MARNKENLSLLKECLLKDGLAEEKISFNIGTFYGEDHLCGTVCCVAGYAGILSNYVPNWKELASEDPAFLGDKLSEAAQKWLGLTSSQADALFYPATEKIGWGDITPEVAAETIQHLINTGKISYDNAHARLNKAKRS